MTLQHTRRIVKSLFILFIIVVCIYLLPRVAINAFYYPDNKVYGPTPAEAESITFTAKDGTHLHGWFIPQAGKRRRDGDSCPWQRRKYVGALAVSQLAARTQRKPVYV